MHLSIIIVNFNTVDVTTNCLSSLATHLDEKIDYEIVLVDNAPKTNNEETFRKVISNLIYIRSNINVGFGRANNIGMDRANGRYYLLLNSDTIILDASIQRCLAFMDKVENSSIGLLGCKLLNEDGSYQASFYPFVKNNLFNYFISNNPILHRLFSVSKAYQEPFEYRKVGDISGASMLLRREVYEKLNGFDPDFFLYCEETEWCRNRISKHYDIVYYPEAAIVHLGGKSAPGNLMFIQSQLSLGLYWYKSGMSNYVSYILYNYFNAIFFLFQYPFSNSQGRSNIKKFLRTLVNIQKYLYFDIPRYNPRFNSRPEPVLLEEAKKIYFQ